MHSISDNLTKALEWNDEDSKPKYSYKKYGRQPLDNVPLFENLERGGREDKPASARREAQVLNFLHLR